MKFTEKDKLVLDAVIAPPPDLQNRWHTCNRVYQLVASKISENEFRAIMTTFATNNVLCWGDNQRTLFELTSIGLAYKEYDKLERRERWKERAYGFAAALLLDILVRVIEFIKTTLGAV